MQTTNSNFGADYFLKGSDIGMSEYPQLSLSYKDHLHITVRILFGLLT